MDLIEKFRKYLKEFDYPNINFLDDNQLADLFTSANRRILLTWLVRTLSSSLVLPTDWESAECVIADYLHESGFCYSSEKDLFVTGDTKLGMKEEVVIFERIFEFLRSRQGPKASRPISVREIEAHAKTDLNLFPKLGYPEALSFEERRKRVAAYNLEILRLEGELERSSFEGDVPESSETQEVDFAEFESATVRLQGIVSAIKAMEKDRRVGFKPEVGESLRESGEVPLQMIQYLDDLNVSFLPETVRSEMDGIVEDNYGTQNANLASEIVKYLVPGD